MLTNNRLAVFCKRLLYGICKDRKEVERLAVVKHVEGPPVIIDGLDEFFEKKLGLPLPAV